MTIEACNAIMCDGAINASNGPSLHKCHDTGFWTYNHLGSILIVIWIPRARVCGGCGSSQEVYIGSTSVAWVIIHTHVKLVG
jgi:hypothetical protein